MEWSKYQTDIFDFVEHGQGSAVIIAVAGSGKTSTVVEAARRLPEHIAATFCAFNKSIADELARRLPEHVRASTIHSLCYRALLRYLGVRSLTVDSRKTQGILTEIMLPDQVRLYNGGLRKLVGLAKAHALLPAGMPGTGLMLDTEQNWADLMSYYGVEFEGQADPLEGIEFARRVLRQSIKIGTQVIDYDDMLYLPVIWQARFFQHDLLVVDEAQDVNAVQRAAIRMALKPEGRLIAVGDPKQSIYGFRGAGINSIEEIKQEFNAREFPLAVSYRCPRAVVRAAQAYVDYIQPSETAPEGKVANLGEFGPDTFRGEDVILCRNTAPLISVAFALLGSGVACRVLGRDIGQGLVRLIKKMEAVSIDGLEDSLASYQERETRKLVAKGKEEQADALEDKVGTIQVFIRNLSEGNRTLEYLLQWIEKLFSDNEHGMLTLSTVHKAKGLEWDRVFILDPHLMPSRWARQAWQVQQEQNICYVAITRARGELYYIGSRNWCEREETHVAAK